VAVGCHRLQAVVEAVVAMIGGKGGGVGVFVVEGAVRQSWSSWPVIVIILCWWFWHCWLGCHSFKCLALHLLVLASGKFAGEARTAILKWMLLSQ